MLIAASKAHSIASTTVARTGHGGRGSVRSVVRASRLPTPTPRMYPTTARPAWNAAEPAFEPIARPTKIRFPVTTLVKVPPSARRLMTSTEPLANVSKPTRWIWRCAPAPVADASRGAGPPGARGDSLTGSVMPYTLRAADDSGEALPDRGRRNVRRGVPDFRIEDLHLHVPAVPGRSHC